MEIGARLKHAWNAFRSGEDPFRTFDIGPSYSNRPDRTRLTLSNERSIIASIFTRIAVDVSSVDIRHVRVDEEGRYDSDVMSGLNECLTLEANIDQASRAFMADIVATMFTHGVAAIVPVDTSINPKLSGSFDIKTMRVGEILAWYPRHIRVELYNDETGRREQLLLEKASVAIVVNPFYDVMNEPNSTLKRIIRKLNLLDGVDEQTSSGKLDLIIQFPYTVKSPARREHAEQRRKDIEFQMTGSKYGIAWADGTEKITQLNRPVENNLLAQIQHLTNELYGQMGTTTDVMTGAADEATMLNYYNRTIEPILATIAQAMRRTFLTKTARTQRQTLMYFQNPFRFVPLENFAEIADKFTRNEILSANELRSIMGIKPSKDPKADELRNSNMPDPNAKAVPSPSGPDSTKGKEGDSQNGST